MADNTIYLVIKQSIYIRGIFGVYKTLDLAKEALQKAEQEEDYHSFYIASSEINKQEYIENNVVFSTPYVEGMLTVVDKILGIKNMLNDKPIKEISL